ncbi:MAG: hypothetical protein KAJ01_03825 [Candidatus Hydrogenedentes bacterium]|nr:hypothetical protein [Candidatus Hydrogenedentota bacterium]
MTTRAIKAGQYEPAEVTKVAANRWTVLSRSTGKKRTVTRFKSRFTCDCPATSPTCRHVTAVLMDEMRAKGWVAAVWTSEAEARRQRRKTWTLTRNGRAFWMTGRPAPEVRRPHKRGRFVEMQLDPYGRGDADCYWMVDGYLGRVSTTI